MVFAVMLQPIENEASGLHQASRNGSDFFAFSRTRLQLNLDRAAATDGFAYGIDPDHDYIPAIKKTNLLTGLSVWRGSAAHESGIPARRRYAAHSFSDPVRYYVFGLRKIRT
jgi:hypothetical protein